MVSIFFVFGLANLQNDLLFRVLDGIFPLKRCFLLVQLLSDCVARYALSQLDIPSIPKLYS